MKVFTVLLLISGLAFPIQAQEKNWEKQWNQILAEAKKEGKVVVMGSADPTLRRELPARFKARYGIVLEYLGGRGADNFSRVTMERQAGVYTTDAVMAGMTNMADYYTGKMLDPLLPAFVLPEVLDGSKWKKGKLWFMDPEGKYILRLYNYVAAGMLYFNTQHVNPELFQSVKELLNPKWKGKISIYDPTISGLGQQDAVRFHLLIGEEFVKRLYIDQSPVFSRDKRQIADWLGRGTYPISLSAETEFVLQMKKQGIPVDMKTMPDAPGTLSAGNGLLGLLGKAAHPNAARVFVNWMASKEGMETLGKARNKPTTRSDINESWTVPWEVPQPDYNYLDVYEWEFNNVQLEKISKRVREIIKAR